MQKCADSLKVEIYITEVYQQRCGWARGYFGGGLDLSVGYGLDETAAVTLGTKQEVALENKIGLMGAAFHACCRWRTGKLRIKPDC